MKFPPGWLPHVVILEGMFSTHTTPLRTLLCMVDYTHFLLARHGGRYLSAGVQEMHIVFDDPGRFTVHPKAIERNRRDPNNETAHEHIHFDDQAKIPSKWRDIIECRKCKHELVLYIGDCLLRIAPKYLKSFTDVYDRTALTSVASPPSLVLKEIFGQTPTDVLMSDEFIKQVAEKVLLPCADVRISM